MSLSSSSTTATAEANTTLSLRGEDAPQQEPTPNAAISRGDVLPDIPRFPSYREERRHHLIQMAATFRMWSRRGYTEGQSGHISIRDPEFPTLMWMNPLSRHFGSLTAGDMLCVEIETGRIVAGRRNPRTGGRTVNAAGYWIHSAIHRARQDAHSVCHAHTIAGRAWSVFARPLEMITQDVCTFYGAHTVYDEYEGIVFGGDEGRNIARSLGTHNKAAILMNHGLLTVGQTVAEAGFLFGLLDNSCAIQLQAEAAAASGIGKRYIGDEEAAYNFRMASEANVLYREGQSDIEYEIDAVGGEEALAKGFDDLEIMV
ncbi:Ribulose-5-phosphate 4-epimerase/Fuculose-1-phosphate aldolase [Geosmithia morbida]|uniref:Ribulose-5-phosphate 4-epimerase/Fuculose-1-phosphate aldolase n=1 Tax=Geosmithia morbida TaxID=1094350 RepID=A0A9P5D5N1_9HYPO|nr:Ribulose-5-phosphate 4-epimerase/Fuculose-1-phosphate aldolase [Geosmithia morbida]KAF4124726.1 Ribulose-5-phosphate 4-epimerase/Fuculose-1-phosphate aldolase [Geosmithia morbida]